MASKAILRRKRVVTGYVNWLSPSIQSLQLIGRGNDSQKLVSRGSSSAGTNDDQLALVKDSVGREQPLVGLAGFRRGLVCDAAAAAASGNQRRSEFSVYPPLGIRWMSHSARNASTAAAKQQELGSDDDEDNQELLAKKRKEASPEECDQAVEGLSTAKAKAKAKKLQESQKAVNSVLQRTWATFVGIGPALRAVASMSKSVSF